ncbi:MAG: FCD domain-containing protein [Anaerolineae bacterium]|nr:FCD domain-containing protein [Anaerolineae bacterium]
MSKIPSNPIMSELVSRYVQQYIIEESLQPGDQLPSEAQMVEELGVGRGSVREAIKILQSLGIVEIQRGNGLYLREYNFDPLLAILVYGMRYEPRMFNELGQIRIWIESSIMDEVVAKITPDDLAELEQIMADWEAEIRAQRPPQASDEAFHAVLYRQVNNQTLNKLLQAFWLAFAELADPDAPFNEREQRIHLRDHQAILDAIKAGDVALARQCLLNNYAYGQQSKGHDA